MARRRRRNALPFAFAAAICAALIALPASAVLYKWIDANGRVVYSDQPPTGNFKAEIVGAAPPPANPEAVKEMANKDAELRKRQLDRAEDTKKAEKVRADAQRLQLLCSQARTQAAGLRRSDGVIYRLNDKGERVVMDEAAKKAEIDRLEGMIRERNCPPA